MAKEYKVVQLALGTDDFERNLNLTFKDDWQFLSCVSPQPEIVMYTFVREKRINDRYANGIKPATPEPETPIPQEEPTTSPQPSAKVTGAPKKERSKPYKADQTPRKMGKRSDEVEVVSSDGSITYKRIKKDANSK